MFKMNKQKFQSNPFQKKSDHIKIKYEIDSNNNSGNNKNGRKATGSTVQRHKLKGSKYLQ